MAESTMTLAELQAKIARRIWENREFEAEFMADPKGTFEKYLGRKLPAELTIHAHYNSPTELHFVVPRRPPSMAGELTDEDLERVAGGETLVLIPIAVTVALSALSVMGTIKESTGDTW